MGWTEATRAGIIELLFKRKLPDQKGRYIHSTDAGKALATFAAGNGGPSDA